MAVSLFQRYPKPMETPHPTPHPTFAPSLWSDLVTAVAVAFRFIPEEAEALHQSKTARLIGSLPFLAGCDQPERTALAHVSVFVLSSRGPARTIFDHTPLDNAQARHRLATIGSFQGGNQAILDRGMNLLALQMICGYARDQAKDLVSGEYNPLLSHAWDARPMMNRLIQEIVDTKSPEMDALFNLDDAQWTWWL